LHAAIGNRSPAQLEQLAAFVPGRIADEQEKKPET
jgi:hypothetical protein